MAWSAPRTWVTAEVVTASHMNTDVRDNFLVTGPAIVANAGEILVADAANSLVARLPDAARVDTSETTASTSYADLATSGPAVTSTVFNRALIVLSSNLENDTAGAVCAMSYALTGAEVSSATDNRALLYESGAANDLLGATWAEVRTGFTSGSTTFTAKYRVTAGTGTFRRRNLSVIPF